MAHDQTSYSDDDDVDDTDAAAAAELSASPSASAAQELSCENSSASSVRMSGLMRAGIPVPAAPTCTAPRMHCTMSSVPRARFATGASCPWHNAGTYARPHPMNSPGPLSSLSGRASRTSSQ